MRERRDYRKYLKARNKKSGCCFRQLNFYLFWQTDPLAMANQAKQSDIRIATGRSMHRPGD